jgi:hypothetical protein
MDHIPEPNEIYRHFKGGFYRIISLAEHTETGETLVVYQALYGESRIFARPLSSFMEPVDKIRYPETVQEMRFEIQSGPAVIQNPVKEQIEPAGGKLQNQKESVPEHAEEIAEKADPAELGTEQTTINPHLMEYLDADTYEEKLQILYQMRNEVTDEILNTMSIAIDIELKDGDLESRYEELKYCLMTRERFECNRLR